MSTRRSAQRPAWPAARAASLLLPAVALPGVAAAQLCPVGERVVASMPSAEALFWNEAVVEGDRALIAAPKRFFGASPGEVYAFERIGGSWVETQVLTASDGFPGDVFGASIALVGDTAGIGAALGSGTPGAVYVFACVAGTWQEQTKLPASDGDAGDAFGGSVALSGDRIVVGAPGDSDVALRYGSAYVFVRVGGVWSEEQKLPTPDLSATTFPQLGTWSRSTATGSSPERAPTARTGSCSRAPPSSSSTRAEAGARPPS